MCKYTIVILYERVRLFIFYLAESVSIRVLAFTRIVSGSAYLAVSFIGVLPNVRYEVCSRYWLMDLTAK